MVLDVLDVTFECQRRSSTVARVDWSGDRENGYKLALVYLTCRPAERLAISLRSVCTIT